MPSCLLDASAVIALLANEPGAERVRDWIRTGEAGLATVNLAEVAARLVAKGAEPADAERQCRLLGLELLPLDDRTAFASASLLPRARSLGLSLGDRVCLATAQLHAVPAVTADRAWAGFPEVRVEVIR
jgi:PIN domain nuclease of toxin-antitoxin system